MSRPSVWVVGNNYTVQRVFEKQGFQVIYNEHQALKKELDLVCFTGGEDVNPVYYNEERHATTKCHPSRDVREMLLYEKLLDKPKIGICRGGQLLNVLSGGKLFQNVNGHRQHHEMIDLLFTKKSFIVPSGHHQMMIPPKDAYVLGIAHEATEFISCSEPPQPKPQYDAEVVWIPNTNSMCYQSHPEWSIAEDKDDLHVNYFFSLIDWAFSLKGVHE